MILRNVFRIMLFATCNIFQFIVQLASFTQFDLKGIFLLFSYSKENIIYREKEWRLKTRDLIHIKGTDKAQNKQGILFPPFFSYGSIIITITSIIQSTISNMLETEISCYVQRYLYLSGIVQMREKREGKMMCKRTNDK